MPSQSPVLWVTARMDDAIHIQVQVIKLYTIGVGEAGVHRQSLTVYHILLQKVTWTNSTIQVTTSIHLSSNAGRARMLSPVWSKLPLVCKAMCSVHECEGYEAAAMSVEVIT